VLEFQTTYDTVRIYFNSRAAFPFVFSVDAGDQSTEMVTPNVICQGVGRFVYNGQEPNPLHPVAWAEFKQARVHRVDEDSEELFVENDSGY
jgi:hypothetical protein